MSHSGNHDPHCCTARPTVSLDQLRHQLLTTTSSHTPYADYGPVYDTMSTSDHHDIHDDDLDSLPSISSGVLSSETADSADAQREWEESLEQVQLLLTMVLVPFAGKYLGRKFAYWSRLSFYSLVRSPTRC